MDNKVNYLLRLGDNAMVLSQRLCELCGKGPALEEDMALSNVSLDLLGQTRMWYTYAAELEGAGRDEDKLAYLRDAHDHIIRVIDTVETYRDLLSGMMDLYMTSVSNRMNEVMKTMTIITTIFVPLTFIVGVYGMNFDIMPELRSEMGSSVVWLVMLFIVILLFIFFRVKKWL